MSSTITDVFPKVANGLSWYKILPNPRWDKTFKKAEDASNAITDWALEKVNDAKARILAKADKKKDDLDISVLEKLIIKNGPESPITVVMVVDMMVAGIDTTGNTAGFFLYNIAR